MRRLLIALLATPLVAATPESSPADLERALAGHWAGTLGYKDYQSGDISKLEVKTEIRAGADGVTVVRVSEFDEGPGRAPAFITSASLYDPMAGTVSIATLRKGRRAELATDRLRVAAFADATHWTIVDEADSRDDDKPAKLRVTEMRDGDRLTATKEAMPEGATTFAFRNVTELTRTGN